MNEVEVKNKKSPKSKVKKVISWSITGVFGALLITLIVFNIVNKYSGNGFVFGSQYPMVLTDSMEPVYDVGEVITVKKITSEDKYDEIFAEFVAGQDGLTGTEDDLLGVESNISNGNTVYTYTDLASDADGIDLKAWKSVDLTFNYLFSGYEEEMSVTHRLYDVIYNPSATTLNDKYTFECHGINKDSTAYNDGKQTFNASSVVGRVHGVNGFLTVFYKCFTSVWGLLILILVPALYLIITSVIDIVGAFKEKEVPESGPTPPVKSDDVLNGLSPEDLERLKKDLLNELMDKGEKK